RGFDSRFLPTLGRPHAVALHFVRCGQLTAGLSPTRLRPCWAHIKKSLSGTRPNRLLIIAESVTRDTAPTTHAPRAGKHPRVPDRLPA
ncbi:hypothetical protein EKG40_14990, partial [Pseudomonas moorei]